MGDHRWWKQGDVSPKIFSEGDIPPKIPRRKKIGETNYKKERKITKSSKTVHRQ